MSTATRPRDPRIIKTDTLRQFVGFLGILLPITLALGAYFFGGCQEVQSSVSDYYHTVMRDIFVGMLSTVAVFLITYRGYDRDYIFSRLAGFAALGVALFPTSIDTATSCLGVIDTGSTAKVHLISAGVFLAVLAYFSLVLFPKTDQAVPDQPKRRRNRVFRISGYVMTACLVLIILYFTVLQGNPQIDQLQPVFWLEAIALLAFGISWLTKGQIIYKDK